MGILKQIRRSLALACLGFVLTAIPAAALTPEDIQMLAQRHGATAASIEDAVKAAASGMSDVRVLADLVAANPLVAALMVADYAALYPKQAAAAIAAALRVQPDQALAITVAAAEMVPEMSQAILAAAVEALPEMAGPIKAAVASAMATVPVGDTGSEAYEPPKALPSLPDTVTIGGALERPPISTDKVASP